MSASGTVRAQHFPRWLSNLGYIHLSIRAGARKDLLETFSGYDGNPWITTACRGSDDKSMLANGHIEHETNIFYALHQGHSVKSNSVLMSRGDLANPQVQLIPYWTNSVALD
jgi:hypothetical protein